MGEEIPHLFPADVFTILTYAKKDAEVPKEWLNSDPHMILGNAEQVSTVPDRYRATSRLEENATSRLEESATSRLEENATDAKITIGAG